MSCATTCLIVNFHSVNTPISLSLIVTALNEEKNISPLFQHLKTFLDSIELTYEVIFVDDGSRDRTYDETLKFSDWKNLKVIKLPRNLGTGGAIQEAFRVAQGEWYAWLPSDLEIMPQELKRPLSLCHDHDVVVTYFADGLGSRTLMRRILSDIFTKIINVAFGHNLPYFNGVSLIRRNLAPVQDVKARGFFFHAELLIRVLSQKCRVIAVPIRLTPRHLEKPKAISFKVLKDVVSCFLNTFWEVKLGHERSHHKNRTH